jgi:hypothetical protein
VLGRVMAGDFAIVTLVLSVTSLLAGVLSGAVGVQWAITVFAAIAASAGTVYLICTRPLRVGALRPPPPAEGPDALTEPEPWTKIAP